MRETQGAHGEHPSELATPTGEGAGAFIHQGPSVGMFPLFCDSPGVLTGEHCEFWE